MALLFCESFDHYATGDLTEKWDSLEGSTVTIESGTGRNGTNCAKAGSNPGQLHKNTGIGNKSTLICGVAVKWSALVAWGLILFLDSGSHQVGVFLTAAGELRVLKAAVTELGITSGLGLVTGTYYFIELKVTFDNSAGSYELRVDGVTKLSGSGIDTTGTANNYANALLISNGETGGRVDDIYLCDNSGSNNNDFLGEVRVKVVLANGTGNYAQWTPSAGSNYQNVDDNPPDDDTTFNSSSTVGQKDSFDMQNVDINGNVKGIQIIPSVRNDGSGVARSLMRVSGTDYFGSNFSLTGSYKFHPQIQETNPNTGALWTVSQIDSAEFGYDLVS